MRINTNYREAFDAGSSPVGSGYFGDLWGNGLIVPESAMSHLSRTNETLLDFVGLFSSGGWYPHDLSHPVVRRKFTETIALGVPHFVGLAAGF